MLKVKSSLIFSLFLTITLFSQNLDIEKKNSEYFKYPLENIFLHLNKTTYISGDEIWFKGYVLNQQKATLSEQTKNVYIDIYDNNLNVIKSKLFLVKDGVFNGQIKVDSLFKKNKYLIKASTNWMKNFNHDNSFKQVINIKSKNLTPVEKNNKSNAIDFQFLPEGGHLIYNAQNSLAFKALNKIGNGIFIKGELYENDSVIKIFKSNSLGHGKVIFHPKEGRKYKAIVKTADNNNFTYNLPLIKKTGINIILTNRKHNIHITINSNNKTSKKRNYKLLIHKNGGFISYKINFNNNKTTVLLNKLKIFNGINTVTLFNENNKPILERLFFNDRLLNQPDLKIEKVNENVDSLTFKISSTKKVFSSISALPRTTISYRPDNNILSSFLLRPYLKGRIEKPSFYFQEKIKTKDLDLLLICQGWSKYKWTDVFNNKQKIIYNFENGLNIDVELKKLNKKTKNVFMFPTKRHSSKTFNISGKKKITLKNYIPFKNETFSFSKTNKAGNLSPQKTNLIIKKIYSPTPINKNEFKFNNIEESTTPILLNSEEEYETLNDVTITSKINKSFIDPIFSTGNITEVTQDVINNYLYLHEFLNTKGYIATIGHGFSEETKLGEVTIFSRRNYNLSGKLKPLIFLDNARLTDFNILYNFRMENIKRVLFDKTSAIGGVNGTAGIIKIYTRKTLRNKSVKKNEISFSQKIKHGFEPTKTFYIPKYISYKIDSYKKYGIIHWLPNVNTINKPYIFKIKNTGLKNIAFFIEGIDFKGNLISKKVTF